MTINMKDAARMLGRSPRWLSSQIAAGRFEAPKIGRARSIMVTDILRFAERQRMPVSVSPSAFLRLRQSTETDHLYMLIIIEERLKAIEERLTAIEEQRSR
jgi:hypothetical protein